MITQSRIKEKQIIKEYTILKDKLDRLKGKKEKVKDINRNNNNNEIEKNTE